ncbi:hypothetical protein TNCT_680211 [Trichonephila clavata]|uniref:Uncharacterized protein n=1 Tax=Trichonephila clavata TaxID=2740835 RepID=A0A8X6HUL3_TRICU|nr:hypothetical protein TNCT_680211 [Trichonephila clavata]
MARQNSLNCALISCQAMLANTAESFLHRILSIPGIDEAIAGLQKNALEARFWSIHQNSLLALKFFLYFLFTCIHYRSIRIFHGLFFDIEPIRYVQKALETLDPGVQAGYAQFHILFNYLPSFQSIQVIHGARL